MIVAIEGMDGVGKTTVAKSIEQNMGFIYVKDPLKDFFEIDEVHLSRVSSKVFNSNNDRLIALYLCLGDCYALSKYKNKNVVMDRHVLLNYFWNGNQDTEQIFKTQVDMFGKPDLTIVLLASSQTRIERISHRNPNDPDLKNMGMFNNDYSKMIDFLIKYGYNYVIVDTEKLSIKETIAECKKIIRGNYGNTEN